MSDNIRTYWGIITDRSVSLDADGFSDPEQTLYSSRAMDTQDHVEFGLAVPARRIADGVKIIPAEVFDPCVIQIRDDGSRVFWAITEGIPFKECDNIVQAFLGGRIGRVSAGVLNGV
jgi:hypothetical protein